ncbi:uncharacterized protein RAG0_12893 [Rhynchosporium agropyri]|uniref:Uncharacterized protein n=2 Tax=Rhynchosporium TaxID=38037 RepID=A0A1E1LAE8_9HELO|nr:uncharacterized protein RAG0_12893 [Rhynchosporium agropyri]CZT09393.1 uncharacterized protein RCO7_07395 [Rhynchosporium commune]
MTLNTIPSISTKALSHELMLAVSESMRPWRWIILSNGKKHLLDFEKFDTACHIQQGSLKLLQKEAAQSDAALTSYN